MLRLSILNSLKFFFFFILLFAHLHTNYALATDNSNSDIAAGEIQIVNNTFKNIKEKYCPEHCNWLLDRFIDLAKENFQIENKVTNLQTDDPEVVTNDNEAALDSNEETLTIQGKQDELDSDQPSGSEIVDKTDINDISNDEIASSSDIETERLENGNNDIITYVIYFLIIILILILISFVFIFLNHQQRKKKIVRNIIDGENRNIINDKFPVSNEDEQIQAKPIKIIRQWPYGEVKIDKKRIYRGNLFLSFNLEKKKGYGEDADPLIGSIDDNCIFISVYDGLGGAGGSILTSSNGEQHTSAYYGSRLVRDFFADLCNQSDPSLFLDKKGMQNKLTGYLKDELNHFESESSGIISKKSNQLPTTLAAILIDNDPSGSRLISMWAGDSRCYCLTKKELQLLSIDDVKNNNNPSDFLMSDMPMTNYINAEGRFEINFKEIKINEPCVLITATDGCFAYYPTPMHFEKMLIETLEASNDIDKWKDNLIKHISEVAQDDSSIALVALGWSSFNELKSNYIGQSDKIFNEYISPLEPQEKEIRKMKLEIESQKKEIEKMQSSMKDKEDIYRQQNKEKIKDYIKKRFK